MLSVKNPHPKQIVFTKDGIVIVTYMILIYYKVNDNKMFLLNSIYSIVLSSNNNTDIGIKLETSYNNYRISMLNYLIFSIAVILCNST